MLELLLTIAQTTPDADTWARIVLSIADVCNKELLEELEEAGMHLHLTFISTETATRAEQRASNDLASIAGSTLTRYLGAVSITASGIRGQGLHTHLLWP